VEIRLRMERPGTPLHKGGLQGGHRATTYHPDSTAITPLGPPLEKGGRFTIDSRPCSPANLFIASGGQAVVVRVRYEALGKTIDNPLHCFSNKCRSNIEFNAQVDESSLEFGQIPGRSDGRL
jgi:hypothetical protein